MLKPTFLRRRRRRPSLATQHAQRTGLDVRSVDVQVRPRSQSGLLFEAFALPRGRDWAVQAWAEEPGAVVLVRPSASGADPAGTAASGPYDVLVQLERPSRRSRSVTVAYSAAALD